MLEKGEYAPERRSVTECKGQRTVYAEFKKSRVSNVNTEEKPQKGKAKAKISEVKEEEKNEEADDEKEDFSEGD